MYTYQQVHNEALKYFSGNELATNVWLTKYALQNKEGTYDELTPDAMHRRMAKEFARVEERFTSKYNFADIYGLLEGFSKVIPQGSIMAMLGNPHSVGSLSNCVVLPEVFDSYGGILATDEWLVQLMKRRCGVGIDISTLRPDGSNVTNAARTSTGGVSFMNRFSNSTREVAQGGRRGALMITCDIRYPDIEKFVKIKQDLSQVTGANISVKLRDDFMQAVNANNDYILRFPVEFDNNEYIEGLLKPGEYNKSGWTDDGIHVKRIKAKELWDTIIECAWNTAEPGLIFWDRQHLYSPSSIYPDFKNISTNPCSEIAMGNDSCRLIAINMMGSMLFPYTVKAKFDFDDWYRTCYKAMYLMDDLVELELDAIEKIVEKIKNDKEPDYIKEHELAIWDKLYMTGQRGRRTGLGLTALADAIAALGLAYDSKEAFEFVEQVMKTKLMAELDAMLDMAEERGAFPAWDKNLEAEYADIEGSFFWMLRTEYPKQWKRMQKVGRRNISWSTLAPTGSLSLLAKITEEKFGTTSGMEPLFAEGHDRKKKIVHNDDSARVDFVDAMGDKWQIFKIYHEGVNAWKDANNLDIKSNPYKGSTANEINWIKRVELQSIIQKYTSHSISSTINLPKNVSKEVVSEIYFEAWRQGLKGITVYRDGCRDGVLTTSDSHTEVKTTFKYNDAPKRPKDLPCNIHHMKVRGTEFTVIVGLFDGNPYEVFAVNGVIEKDYSSGILMKKVSGRYDLLCTNGLDTVTAENITRSMTDEEAALTRMISTALRHGASIKFIVEQLEKTEGNIISFSKSIARTLKKYVSTEELLKRAKCKDCGSTELIFEEGCSKCVSCGSSKCS